MTNFYKMFIIIFLLYPISGFTGSSVKDKSKKYKEMVKKQHSSDIERKEALLRKMRAFMDEINGVLRSSNSKTRIDMPVDIDKVEDIDDKKHKYSFKENIKKVYAYINSSNVNIRTAPSTGERVIGLGGFAEKVEILAQTNYMETIGGIKSRWVLIRRSNANEDEGWIFGAFLSKNKPERKEKPQDKKKIIASSKKGFLVPTEGRRSSNYGYRIDPITKKRKSFHRGIDIAAPTGTPIKAAADGTVIRSGWSRGYGNLTVIKHEKDLATYYAHQSKRLVRKGQKVRKGQVIGKVGSTGRSTGPHLHFEVRRGRTALNPNRFIR